MSLELVTAISSVVTALVIGATAIAAMIQLRHMRMSNQITALLAIQDEFDSQDYRAADTLIRQEFPAIFEEDGFCEYLVAVMNDREAVENARYTQARVAARLVGNTYENLGALVKRNIIDRAVFLDVYSWIIADAWNNLEGWVALTRWAVNEVSIYENFEYIAVISQDHLAENPVIYPAGLRRLNPRLPAAAARFVEARTAVQVKSAQ
jgi:hypothetical protein